MKRLFNTGLVSLLLLPQLGWATDALYTNSGLVTFPPQIDAVTFINSGTFDFTANTTSFPFDTSNTRNFTNSGTMIGSIGFQFDTAPSTTGVRSMAANFQNRVPGTITSVDGGIIFVLENGQPFTTTLVNPSFLVVSATNLINEGSLIAGSAGILRLTGTNVNLSRSGIEIAPLAPIGSIKLFTNYFSPDVGIYDIYWGQSNQVMNSANLIQKVGANVTVSSPPSLVTNSSGFGFTSQIRLINPVGSFYSNSLAMTNITYTNVMNAVVTTNVPLTNVIQAVFVGLPTTAGAEYGIKFTPSEDPQNPFNTVSVGISLTSTNVVTAGQDVAAIYLVDTLASTTNRGLLTNFVTSPTARPQNYTVERLEPFEFASGTDGNVPVPTDILFKLDFATRFVTNEYAAYADFVDDIASRPPNIPSGTITNLPGRIEIFADSLDMSRTRFRANGLLNIQARHLISSSNTLVDCENLSYTLGSTNGNLKIQNLAQESVSRLHGNNYVWSGLWTNFENLVIKNYGYDATGTNFISLFFTNVVETRLYAMVFDATAMVTEVPVIVNALVTHSTNVVINDKMTVVQSLLIDGQSFTLNGGITLSNTSFIDTRGNTVVVSLNNWVGTNAPNMKFFTNNGTLNIPNEAHFGDDLATPYSAFVNSGTINAFSEAINSDYVGISGQEIATASLILTTRSGTVQGGTLSAGVDIQLFADNLKFSQATVQAGARLDLTVANALFDSGGASGNSFSSGDGFRLLHKPATGDLLGTSFNSIAQPFAEVDHVWAANDLGPTSAGFQNNESIGTLVLTPGLQEAAFPPLFVFGGTGGGNALYVDLLDLSKLSDYQDEIQINPDLIIYYAAAKLNFTPPLTNGAPQEPEEFLDGQFGGHLRWVRDFAGPNSSVAVIINGVSVLVNRALRDSLIIDSNGNGIPNGLDFYPFDNPNPLVAKLAVPKQTPLTAVLSWNALAHKVYSIQATTNCISPTWQTVMYYTNSASSNGPVNCQIPVPAGCSRQFYRVGTAGN